MIRIQERRTAARLSAITAASALATVAALAAAAPAMADDGVKATYKGMAPGQKTTVKLTGHGERDIHAGLMNLQVQGSGAPTLSVYCIDLENPVGQGDNYAEGKWDDTWLGKRADDGGKVKWILLNSYPTKTVEQLKAATGASGLDESEAGAATQAAIWHFSDHSDLDPGAGKNDPDVKKVYDWLVQNAKVEPGEGTRVLAESGEGRPLRQAVRQPGRGAVHRQDHRRRQGHHRQDQGRSGGHQAGRQGRQGGHRQGRQRRRAVRQAFGGRSKKGEATSRSPAAPASTSAASSRASATARASPRSS
ncbi:thioester domain-containing protein [Yinghuangia aomiensis]